MKTHSSLDTNKLDMCFLLIGCNVTPKGLHCSRIQREFVQLPQNVLRCNYGERQWEIGYSGIQNRYVASIGKITVLHDWLLTVRAVACENDSIGCNVSQMNGNRGEICHYRPRSLAKQGDNALGSVRPSVRPFTHSCLNRLTFDLDFWCGGRPWPWLAWEGVKENDYQSKMFVCVSTNSADSVDRLLYSMYFD